MADTKKTTNLSTRKTATVSSTKKVPTNKVATSKVATTEVSKTPTQKVSSKSKCKFWSALTKNQKIILVCLFVCGILPGAIYSIYLCNKNGK